MQKNIENLIITAEQAGQRLDKIIQLMLPDISIRQLKTLWDDWHITVNDKAKPAGYSVQAGDIIKLNQKTKKLSISGQNLLIKQNRANKEKAKMQQYNKIQNVNLIHEHGQWLFFAKPRGIHSVYVNGGGISVEEYLWNNPPATLRDFTDKGNKLVFCNRLDSQTSGILVASRSEQGLETWQKLENSGKCQKQYIAIVQSKHDNINKNGVIRQALDTDKRKITKVLAERDEDILRHTVFKHIDKVNPNDYKGLRAEFTTFAPDMPQNLTWIGASIRKGARHQIRTHAAFANFPLYNDVRYTQKQIIENEDFLLHNYSILYAGQGIFGLVICKPSWENLISTETLEKNKKSLQEMLK